MTPQFKHDCSKCIHLGSTPDHDLYFCYQGTKEEGLPTVIARWGDSGPDYISGIEMAKASPAGSPLSIALQLAKTQKLIA